MDPNSLLDYALFQLTPTRTRCDLVVFRGGISEKLASGLLEPFVSHLKFAKDEIPKGGYSIKLRPPKSDAYWFSKSTFQRFVRFVSTPEVLERFARLEKEILQIENSVQSNELTNGYVAGQMEEGSLSNANGITKQSPNSSKLKGETDATNEAEQEENSKILLHRLLETRKALLRKEQAMAYARALAAGFELEDLDDLVCFADTFGASRLREACTEFKDLCMKKHTDDLWMDELAAMKACPQPELPFLGTSGIILASEIAPYQNSMLNFENNGKIVSNVPLDVSSDSITSQENSDGNKDNHVASSDQTPSKVQMPWPNQIPPYMFNFHSPGQQVPPYQGYPFPAMQPLPPYYPANMHWPQAGDESTHGLTQESDHHQNRKSSSRKKEKSPNLEEQQQSESSNSDSRTEPEGIEKSHKKKNRKKSSKTVVIRNINYITSKKRNEEKDRVSYDSSSGDDESVDEESLHKSVKDVLGTLEKHHKPKSNHKKRGGDKSSINGSNGSAEKELENDLVTNYSKGQEGNKNWGAFQNLLMSERESITNAEPLDEHFTVTSSIDRVISGNVDPLHFDSEKVLTRKTFGTDSFIVSERSEVNEGRVNVEIFDDGEVSRVNMKKRDSEVDALLFPQRFEESKSILTGKLSDIDSESSIIKSGKGEDWFVVNHTEKSEIRELTIEQTMLRDSYALSPESDRSGMEGKKSVPIDDSFMIQAQSSIDDQYDSHWRTDISMVSDIIATSQPENDRCDFSQNKVGASGAYEPDDLCVVLARDLGAGSIGASWSPEVDYGVEASFTEAENKSVSVETNEKTEEKKFLNGKSSASPGENGMAKQIRSKGLQGSLAKSRLDVLSKSKKPLPSRSVTQKNKLEKEEEARKRAEELLIERQKRIAERTAASGVSPAAAKKVPLGSKVSSPKIYSPKWSVANSAKNHLVNGHVKPKTSVK